MTEKRSGAAIAVLTSVSAAIVASKGSSDRKTAATLVRAMAKLARTAEALLPIEPEPIVVEDILASVALSLCRNPKWMAVGDYGNAEHVFEIDFAEDAIRYRHVKAESDLEAPPQCAFSLMTPKAFEGWVDDPASYKNAAATDAKPTKAEPKAKATKPAPEVKQKPALAALAVQPKPVKPVKVVAKKAAVKPAKVEPPIDEAIDKAFAEAHKGKAKPGPLAMAAMANIVAKS